VYGKASVLSIKNFLFFIFNQKNAVHAFAGKMLLTSGILCIMVKIQVSAKKNGTD